MAFVNEKTESGQWQTIDRERSVALLYKGRMGGDSPYDFEFQYEGQKFLLSAFRNMKKNSSGEDDITWNIVKLFIPENLKSDRSKITALIIESFDACGFLFSRKHVESVTVIFKTPEI